jgi:arylsulfatase A-like enzyme
MLLLLYACNKSIEKSFEKPNILIFFVDDLGYNDVGFRNSKFYTPNIDRLASQGMVINSSYVASPTSSPSRAGLYTGQHPARLRFFRHIPDRQEGEYNVWNGDSSLLLSRNYLPIETVTYAEVAKNKGYNTFFVGKWHLGNEEYGPQHQGWDRTITKPDAGQPRSYYSPYFPENGFWNDIENNQYLTDFFTDKTIDYIENYASEDPFLIQFSFHNVHTPNIGREDFLEMYRERGFVGKLVEYGAQVSAVDESVGRVIDALQKSGLSENTLIIFTSDQGSFFPNLPLRGTKEAGTTLYEGGQKVPFIVKWPGIVKEGLKSDIHIQTTDIFPTICEIVGDNPDNYDGLEGMSLLDVFIKNKPLERDAIFSFRSYDAQFGSVLTSDNWKLIAYRGSKFELFKIDEDISEESELSIQYPEKVEELSSLLDKWLINTGVEFD